MNAENRGNIIKQNETDEFRHLMFEYSRLSSKHFISGDIVAVLAFNCFLQCVLSLEFPSWAFFSFLFCRIVTRVHRLSSFDCNTDWMLSGFFFSSFLPFYCNFVFVIFCFRSSKFSEVCEYMYDAVRFNWYWRVNNLWFSHWASTNGISQNPQHFYGPRMYHKNLDRFIVFRIC